MRIVSESKETEYTGVFTCFSCGSKLKVEVGDAQIILHKFEYSRVTGKYNGLEITACPVCWGRSVKFDRVIGEN